MLPVRIAPGLARRLSRARPATSPSQSPDRDVLFALLLALLITGWLAVVILANSIHFVVYNPRAKTGFEVFLALGQLFGALVLALSSLEPARPRIRWVAMALLVLGTGGLGIGYLVPLSTPEADPDVTMYGSILTRLLAATLLVTGLVPSRPPRLGRAGAAGIMTAGGLVTLALVWAGERLPTLLEITSWQSLDEQGALRVFPGLTPWYQSLDSLALAAALTAVWGTLRHRHERHGDGWLLASVVIFAGAQLHSLFWPSGYSSILTTTSVLRLAWALVIVFGAVIELYRLSRDRTRLLAEEQERVHQLEALNTLKRDFSSMVAHELGTPLAAIGNLAQMISMGALSDADQRKAASRIQGEARILQLLVRDVQQSADVEREDFAVDPRPISLEALLEDARGYAGTVRTSHPITVEMPEAVSVTADPERIGQVIRNLLNNAVRHTPKGTPIHLIATREGGRVRIDVADEGPGIANSDLDRILEKFGRGVNAAKEGHGLGLYLSSRILRAHGTDLSIASEPGQGACFSFWLEEVP